MRNSKWIVLALVLAVAALTAGQSGLGAEEGTPGTLRFKAHNQMYSADGTFKKWKLTKVEIPDGDMTRGRVEFEVDLASVSEKAADLAEHLRTADFFDVAKYTTATVKIDRAKSTGEGSYEAVAVVSFHGHDVEVPVRFQVVDGSPLKIEGSATLNRMDFGIGRPYAAGNDRSIVEEVEILIELALPE